MVKKQLPFTFFFFFLFSVAISSDDDFTALLSFKSSLLDPSNSLSSWVLTNNSTNSHSGDPCSASWYGVVCHPRTRRVIRLVLENLNLTSTDSTHDQLAQLTHLRLLSLKYNHLSFPLNFSSHKNLKHLYLSHNRFSSSFPDGIPHLRHLRRLDLSYNRFHGEIPVSELGTLPLLLTVQLEGNSFTGTLGSVNSLPPSYFSDFNVSNNYLSGEIPVWLSRLPASSFDGNVNLCGKPLMKKCVNQTLESQPVKFGSKSGESGKSGKLSNWVVLLIMSVDVVAILAALVTITWCCFYRRKRMSNGAQVERKAGGTHHQLGGHYDNFGGGSGGGYGGDEEMVVFEGCKGFSGVDDLLKSSAELLGKGCVGTTYKLVLDGGDAAVVKRVRQRSRRKEVDGWLRMIGGLRHCNVVSLRAYFNSNEELLLVYDFLPNGSLHQALHENRGPGRSPLDWTTRLKLASGSAQGLVFLHGCKKPKLIYGNLTSSNILIDHLGNACISDIGLHQLLHSPSLADNNGYRAPELMQNSHIGAKFTQKSDVYSFGVILLEILTGKMPTGEGETSLVKWVQRVAREEWTWEVFDFELLRYKEMEEEMVALMQVALLCLAPSARDRPKMSMVHVMIEDIRTKGACREGGRNSILNDLSSDSSPSLSESAINFTSES